ncbi:hypothetical protein Bbelb_416180 [Branchiostoma belcheri]|nr:hypothetical protein Bbelb_416180 [Branchiostoma belcheri]
MAVSGSVFSLLLLCFPLCLAQFRSVHDMIYVNITAQAPCVRLMNATHQIGCTSAVSGNVGVLHYCAEQSDVDWLVRSAKNPPYMPLMVPPLFTYDNVQALRASGKVSGILVVYGNRSDPQPPPTGFSPVHKCPNDGYGLYKDDPEYAHCKNTTWNPLGTGLSYLDFDFPISLLLNQTDVDNLIDCYNRFNKYDNESNQQYPLCAVQIKDRMDGAKDSITCIRRSELSSQSLNPFVYCDALGDKNVWGTLRPLNKSAPLNNTKDLILASAKIDTWSLFHNVGGVGANDATGFIALLAAAEALGKLDQAEKEGMKDVMFVFFQGESFDYIGSSRMVYDMKRGQFPEKLDDEVLQPSLVNTTNIQYYLEVSQVGLWEQSGLWAHSDPVSQKTSAVRDDVNAIFAAIENATESSNVSVRKPPSFQALPPASLQRFLREDSRVAGMVLSDHMAAYSNDYFMSRLDLPVEIGMDIPVDLKPDQAYDYTTKQGASLTKVATVIARTLYLLASNKTASEATKIEVNGTTVNHLLYCFLQQANCPLFAEVLTSKSAAALKSLPGPLPRYVSVPHDMTNSQISQVIANVLTFYLGERLPSLNKSSECKTPSKDHIHSYIFMNGRPVVNPTDNTTSYASFCIRAPVRFSKAESPAFLSKEMLHSNEYPSWTESRWTVINAKIFLVSSEAEQTITLSVGVVVLLVSLVLVYFINSKSDVLFTAPEAAY